MFMLTAIQLNILVTLTGAESAEDVAEQVRVSVYCMEECPGYGHEN